MTCACKKNSCVQECVKITEDDLFYLMVKMYHLKAHIIWYNILIKGI